MTVSSSIGPVSGIDYGKLITALSSYQQQPIDDITKRLTTIKTQSTALTDLTTMLTNLRVSAANFISPAIFAATTASSSNTGVATASASIGAPIGSYNFTVQQLASASQSVSQGFADAYNTPLGLTGSITLQSGKGRLDDPNQLKDLNGGNGVARGSIRITDASGASTLIDLSSAVNINDVLNALNSNTAVNVTAKVDGDHLVIADSSGGAGTLKIANAGGTTTAADLGLTAPAASGTITGTSLTKLQGTTSLDSLNDGNGVRLAGVLNDFSITGAGGAFDVSLNGAKTLADVITKINGATGNTGVTAAISTDGHGLTLTDSGGGPVSVAAENNSFAAYDLGLTSGTAAANTLTGGRVTGDLNSPLLNQLNGGNEGATSTLPTPGTISINGTSIDLSAARTLNDVIKGINASGTSVTAQLNGTGNGISLTSTAASFTVADVSGNLSSFLKISGASTAAALGSHLNSGDLRQRFIAENTLLSTLNGGAGFKAGKIRLTDGTGAIQTIDLSTPDITTIGAVIKKINASGLAITARVNDTGDGILLNQTAGTLNASVAETDIGQTASSLGILGTFAGNKLDGSFQKTVTIAATDKLSDVVSKINSAGAGVAASIINDGSGATPYRLNLASRNSGSAGRLSIDGTAAGMNFTTLVQGQDAVVVYGGNSNGTGGLVSTSSTNAISGVVPSLTVNLSGIGHTTVNVTNDSSKIGDTIQTFVDSYNKVVDTIATDTQFDSSNPANSGPLFGNSTVQQVLQNLGGIFGKIFTGVGQFKTLAAVGLTIGQDGTLSFNSNTLDAALATSAADVKSLFTTNKAAVTTNLTSNPVVIGSPAVKGVGATLSDLLDKFTNAQTGLLFAETDSLATQTTQLNKRVTQLQDLLTIKKNQLILQFASLETTISQLQSQSSAITNFKPITSTSSSK